MKKRRKHKKCLNCNQPLLGQDNYCANCGQENTDNQVGVGLLIREFTSNFFSLDSRFGRTLKPFLFKPGKVTIAFNEGKRVQYANPIRWYLVISILHFFFFMQMVDLDSDSTSRSDGVVINRSEEELTRTQFDSLYVLPDSLHDQQDWPIPDHYFAMAEFLSEDDELSTNDIMDSLQLNNLPWLKRQASKKIIKIEKDPATNLVTYVLKQIPVIMFFILPLYAFILKLFHWRKGLYIKHLIHSLHIHSFFFFVMTVVWIFSWIFSADSFQSARNYAGSFGIIASSIYILISMRKVYQVKWVWTSFRFLIIGLLYTALLTVSMGVGFVISLAFY